MEIQGTVHSVLPLESGEAKSTGKAWQKRTFVIDYKDGTYDKQVAMTVMGDKVTMLEQLKKGQPLTAYFNVASREYNGKWYTDAQCWKIATETVSESIEQVGAVDDDLPF